MTDPKQTTTTGRCDFFYAKLMVALELRRTHGIVFAAAFLDQFAAEIGRAASREVPFARNNDKS